MMAKHQPASIEEANALLKQLQDRRNCSPLPEFFGLSPEMMHRFLSFPVDSPDLIEYPQTVTCFPDGFRLAHLFELLVTAIGDKGIKTTVNGNLPLLTVKSIATEWLTPEEYDNLTRSASIRTESQFRQLHLVRILSEMAGMIRKIHGRLVITKACLQLQERSLFNEIYPRLFMKYVTKFNWQYLYAAPATAFMQRSFAFTIYLLDKFGDDWRPASFYEDAFMNAFPDLSNADDRLGFADSPEMIKWIFTRCNVADFGVLFGFAEAKYDNSGILRHVTEVRKTELLSQLVKFHIPT
jgi:hypothetical protein